MQNLTIEFSALGDLKLAEKPTPHTIGPHGFHSIKVNFKVCLIRLYPPNFQILPTVCLIGVVYRKRNHFWQLGL